MAKTRNNFWFWLILYIDAYLTYTESQNLGQLGPFQRLYRNSKLVIALL